MDRDIETLVQTCYECQQHRHDPPKAPLHPWTCQHSRGHAFTSLCRAFSRIHVCTLKMAGRMGCVIEFEIINVNAVLDIWLDS